MIYCASGFSAMRRVAFTVDVDRDVNMPFPGRWAAASSSKDGLTFPRFSSSAHGLLLLVGLLDDLGIHGTFFLEAETARHISLNADLRDIFRDHEVASHGLSHEDLTGASTGVPLTRDEKCTVIDRSADALEAATGRRPRGFRAPYQHIDDETFCILSERGYLYDSSVTDDILGRWVGPRPLPCGLIEVPLARGRDVRGHPIHSYLWPMHEGKRRPADYHNLFDQYDHGLMVIATHSWHVVETFSGPLDDGLTEANLADVRTVLEEAMDRGLQFDTLEGHVEELFRKEARPYGTG